MHFKKIKNDENLIMSGLQILQCDVDQVDEWLAIFHNFNDDLTKCHCNYKIDAFTTLLHGLHLEKLIGYETLINA